jgi:hypothetical protein
MPEPDQQTPICSTGSLPISPSLQPTLVSAHVPRQSAVLGPRVSFIGALAATDSLERLPSGSPKMIRWSRA